MLPMNAEQITINTDMVGHAKRFAGIRGFLAAFIMSSSTVGMTFVVPDNQLVNLVCVVMIPFIVAFIFLKNVMHALTLVWLNEMFFGVGGMWMKVGPIPGRGVLLLVVLLIYIINRSNVISNIKRNKRDSWIVFYGTILPSMLLGYSVIIRGNDFSDAFADVQRFLTIIIFFPLRDLIRRHFSFVFGWLICAAATLSLLFVSLAVAPENFKIVLLERWLHRFSDVDNSFTEHVLQTGRAAFTPLILCMIGVFIGIIYTIDIKIKALTRLGSVLLLSITVAAFVVNFLRGPIIAIIIVLMLLAILVSGFKRARITRGVNLIIVIITTISLGYIATTTYIPIALTKWDVSGLAFEEAVDPVRIEQMEVMLNAWLEEPILGQGVGSPISGDVGGESGRLAFEVQYPMILYRTGLIGFGFIMAPLLWILSRTVRRTKQIPELIGTDEGKLLLAMGCSVGALLITSWVNPYLASSMTFVFIALFLAVESKLPIIKRRRFLI